MRKIICLLSSVLFISISFSQTYPSYSITACDTSSKGYYFFVAQKLGTGSNTFNPVHSITDGKGNLVYYKYFTGATNDFKIHGNGRISYSRLTKSYIMDSTFQVIDSVSPKNGIAYDGHDLQLLANGHYLLLGSETVTMDLSSYNYFGGNNSPGSASASVRCGVIQELDQNKNVVFQWHCKDHYNFLDVDQSWLSNPGSVDWNHVNAVEQDNDGNFLLSVRHFNEITKIKRSDSSIIWRFGGNANQFNFLNDPQKFMRQHDIRRISNGNITLFDNGVSGNTVHPATAKEYQLNEISLTASLVTSYTENPSLSSSAMGNVQKLANGNKLIDYGWYRGSTVLFNVINPLLQKSFEIRFTDSLRSYRAFNYLTLPWSLNRPQVTCTVVSNQVYLDAGSGHASYLWSNGATTQSILVSNTGTFNVWVPKGQGGFISSDTFTVQNLTNPCLLTGLEESQPATKIITNSFFDHSINIQNPTEQIMTVELRDVSGRLICHDKSNAASIDIQTTACEPGIYLLRVNDSLKKMIKLN